MTNPLLSLVAIAAASSVLVPAGASASQAADIAPVGRGAAAAAWDSSERRLIVFGGIGSEPRALGDLWIWTTEGWSNPSVPGGPSARFNSAAAFLEAREQFVLHGGGGIDERTSETWVLEGGTWRTVRGDGPGRLDCARMVHRPDHDDLILYGGMNGDGFLRETWRWDGTRWSRLATDGPPSSCFHAMAYDERRGRIVLFGGRGENVRGESTWEFTDEAWQRVDASGPPARDHHAMAFDARRGVVVLFGGGGQDDEGDWDGGIFSDTWEWDGETWVESSDGGAPARFHAPALVGTDGGVLLFGGSDTSGSHADVWRREGTRWRRVDSGAFRRRRP